MDRRRELLLLALAIVLFALAWMLPVGRARFDGAVLEALHVARAYAREHVLLCLVPAFLVAGAVAVFVSRGAVMRCLGPEAPRLLSYGVASVSGSVLAVCSCTVLPLFAGIHRAGAGLGPAVTFLYAGPAINALALIVTARVLGWELGLARAVGAIVSSLVVGLVMARIFRKADAERATAQMQVPEDEAGGVPVPRQVTFLLLLLGLLVLPNWAASGEADDAWSAIATHRWLGTAALAVLLGTVLVRWFGVRGRWVLAAAAPALVLAVALPERPVAAYVAGVAGVATLAAFGGPALRAWLDTSWDLAKQVLPLLALGVLVSGLLLGRPGHEGLVPSDWITAAVGGNSLGANLAASVVGALMYFATLTEVPILEGLLGAGMGRGPALALLLAGPAVSLPNLLVVRSVLGTRQALAYAALVVVLATTCGLLFGAFVPE